MKNLPILTNQKVKSEYGAIKTVVGIVGLEPTVCHYLIRVFK